MLTTSAGQHFTRTDPLGQALWAEVVTPSAAATATSSLRQGLQRPHLNILTSLVLRNYGSGAGVRGLLGFVAPEFTLGAPDEARVLARYPLRQPPGRSRRWGRSPGQGAKCPSAGPVIPPNSRATIHKDSMFFPKRWRNTPSPEVVLWMGSIGNRLPLPLVTSDVALPLWG